jgi:hypothetical protein
VKRETNRKAPNQKTGFFWLFSVSGCNPLQALPATPHRHHHAFIASENSMCCIPRRRKAQKPSFADYCASKNVNNELAFYRAAIEFQTKTGSNIDLRGDAKTIYDRFMAPGSPNEVFLTASTLAAIKQRLRKPSHSLFQQASFEMVTVLQPILLDFVKMYKIHHSAAGGLQSLAQLSQQTKKNK